jgi:uncharacterized membrane protein
LIALALIVVSIVFAANTPWYFVFKMLHAGAAVVWVGGGLFITICAVLAELANDDDQLLQIGHWAETVAGRLFPAMSFVVLGFGIAMTSNGDIPYNQFWIIFGLAAWALSAATGMLFLGPGSEAPEQGRRRTRTEVAGGAGEVAADPARRPSRRSADVPDRLRHGGEAVQLLTRSVYPRNGPVEGKLARSEWEVPPASKARSLESR